MKHKSIYIFISLIFLLSPAYSQSYNQLIQERADLLQQLEETESQNSALFGKKSKKDLRNATELMKDIIQKDKEIIATFKREVNKKESLSQEPIEEFNQRIIELEGENAKLNSIVNKQNQEKAEIDTQVEVLKDRMFKYQTTILVTFLIIFVMAMYISKQRKKFKLKKQEAITSS